MIDLENLKEAANELLIYMENLGLTERESAAAMGIALVSLIADKQEARDFIRLLRSGFGISGDGDFDDYLKNWGGHA